jgi:uncharacterized protein YkwD
VVACGDTVDAAGGAEAERWAIEEEVTLLYAHRNPDGLGPHQRIRAAGYDGSATGENIH